MAWDRPILTDSGGFQVVSLGDLRSIDDDGVTFRSHLDGTLLHFTPEHAIAVQEALGADIAVCLDQPVPPHASSRTEVAEATARTARWAERCSRLIGARTGPLRDRQGGPRGRSPPPVHSHVSGLPFDGLCIGEPGGDETPSSGAPSSTSSCRSR
jgi:queuine/archaeosine tRNA-ribosyltransferase